MLKLIGPDGLEFEVIKEETLIGRSPKSDIVLDDPLISGKHAIITVNADGEYMLEDLDSTNGTRVNGKAIAAPYELAPGAVVGLGNTDFTVEIEEVEEKPLKATMVMGSDDIEKAKAEGSGELLVDLDTTNPEFKKVTFEEADKAAEQEEDTVLVSDEVLAAAAGDAPTPVVEVEEAEEESKATVTLEKADEPADEPEELSTVAMTGEEIDALKTGEVEKTDEPAPTPAIDATELLPTLNEQEKAAASLAVPPPVASTPSPVGTPAVAPVAGVGAAAKQKMIGLLIEIGGGLLSFPGGGWIYAGEQQRGIITLAIGAGLLLLNVIVIPIIAIPTVGIGAFCYCATIPALLGVVGYSAYQLNEYMKERPDEFE